MSDEALLNLLETAAAEFRRRLAAGGPAQLGAALAFVMAAIRKVEEAEK